MAQVRKKSEAIHKQGAVMGERRIWRLRNYQKIGAREFGLLVASGWADATAVSKATHQLFVKNEVWDLFLNVSFGSSRSYALLTRVRFAVDSGTPIAAFASIRRLTTDVGYEAAMFEFLDSLGEAATWRSREPAYQLEYPDETGASD